MRLKTRVRKILATDGRLSGLEAGRLLLEDSWEVDHGREGFLSQEDMQAIRRSLKTDGDIRQFNRLMETYRILDYSIKESQASFFNILFQVEKLLTVIEAFRIEALFEDMRGMELPYVVSEKEYEDYRAEHKETISKEFQPLQFVLSERIAALEPAIEKECQEKTGEETWQDASALRWASVYYPETWKKALQSLSEKVMDGLEMVSKDGQKAREETLKDFSSLERWKLPAKKTKMLLEEFGFTGWQLLKAGFPEWEKRFEEFTPGHIGSLENNFGMCFAILKHPPGYMLDDKGYSTVNKSLERFRRFASGYLTDNLSRVRDGGSLQEITERRYSNTKRFLTTWLAYYEALKLVSDYVGVRFTEDFEGWYQEIASHIQSFNNLLNMSVLPQGLRIEPLNLEKLQPSNEMLAYLKERMAISLGPEWFEELAKGISAEHQRRSKADA